MPIFLQQPRRNTRKRARNYSNRTRMISPNFGISASKMWGEERQVGWQEEMICFPRFLEKMTGARKNTLRSVLLMNCEHSFVVVSRITNATQNLCQKNLSLKTRFLGVYKGGALSQRSSLLRTRSRTNTKKQTQQQQQQHQSSGKLKEDPPCPASRDSCPTSRALSRA